jgi:hypothetical protein
MSDHRHWRALAAFGAMISGFVSPRGRMTRRFPLIVGLLSAVSATAPAEAAQHTLPYVRSVETKSGVPVVIGNFISCIDHSPFEGTAFVEHGKVTMKRVTINHCGNPKEPATQYWYVSDPGFKGIDEVNFSSTSGSALLVHVTVR